MVTKSIATPDFIHYANEALHNALNKAYEDICDIVRGNGSFFKTASTDGQNRTAIIATYYDVRNGRVYRERIHGLRWDSELGLTLCTDDMLENYQFDNEYYFEKFFDFEGKDAVEIEKVLADPAYFVEFDTYDLNPTETIISILGGLQDYV